MTHKQLPPHKIAGWAGYTLDELRYQEAYVAARLQIKKEQLVQESNQFKGNILHPQGAGLMSRIGTLMDYAGYGLMAYKMVKQAVGLLKKARS